MDEDGDATLEDAVGEALDRVLGRVPAPDRVAAFRALRTELERCVAEAPMTGAEAALLRARLVAVVAAHEPVLSGPVSVAMPAVPARVAGAAG
ncbi:hypothetical protein [Roseomonas sp. WA12]